MKRKYRLPIVGIVLNDKPLTGDATDPIRPIDLSELMPKQKVIDPDGEEREVPKYGYSCISLDYNVDEEWVEVEIEADKGFHGWLLGLIPSIKDIANSKGWRLDKTKLEEVRKARSLADNNP